MRRRVPVTKQKACSRIVMCAARWLLKKTRRLPRVVVTDNLRSYKAAHREVMPSIEHRQPKYLNNRAENSHQPTRQRERAMKGFRSVGGPSGSCPRSAASHPTSGPAAI
jgi:putative transposase